MLSKLYFDKNKEIVKICKGKRVLDLGVIDHDVGYEMKKNWLHGDIKKVSKNLTGIDIDSTSVDVLKKKGYNVFAMNAERFNLKKKFDVVVAGDLIEHLDNVGNFLESVRNHLSGDGEFILTTPNSLSFANWVELIIFGKIKYINGEHTHWYDENTLRRAIENKGFVIKEISFVLHNPHFIGEGRTRTFFKKIRHIFGFLLCGLRKQFAPTLLMRCKKK